MTGLKKMREDETQGKDSDFIENTLKSVLLRNFVIKLQSETISNVYLRKCRSHYINLNYVSILHKFNKFKITR